MSIPKKITVNCSKCGHSIASTVFESVNSDYAKDLASQIMSGELFNVECPHCGFVSHLEYDFLYHDLKHGAMIWVVHNNSTDYASKIAKIRGTPIPPYKTLRIVEDMNALKEKVSCLECNRDDRIVELCKVVTVGSLLEKYPDFDFRNVFYTAVSGKEIIYIYDMDNNFKRCDLPEDVYSHLQELYYSSSFFEKFDNAYAIVDYAWAEEIMISLMDAEEKRNEVEKNISESNLLCPNCSKKLPEDSEFCQYCGNKIEAHEDSIEKDETNIDKMTPEEAAHYLLNIQAKNTIEAMETNKETQPSNEGDVDFGLVPEKPIYTLALQSIDGERAYLNKLYTTNGEKIKYNRRGSMSVDGINGMIDIYDTFLPSGKLYKTIYINMYGIKASKRAPSGFVVQRSQQVKKPANKQSVEKVNESKYSILDIINIFVLLLAIIISGVGMDLCYYTYTEETFASILVIGIIVSILKIIAIAKFKNNIIFSIVISCGLFTMTICSCLTAQDEEIGIWVCLFALYLFVCELCKIIKMCIRKYRSSQSYKLKCYKKINLLNEYREKGVITQEEFVEAKKQIVSKIQKGI